MREETLQFMRLTLAPFEQTVENLVNDWRDNFKKGFGEPLPPETLEVLRIIEGALNSKRAELEEQTAKIYESKLSEEDVRAILAHLESPVGKKLAKVSPTIQNEVIKTSSDWLNSVLKMIEPDLTRLLDGGASGDQELTAEPAVKAL